MKNLRVTSIFFSNGSTLRNYLSKVIFISKDIFPKHCAWEEPDLITRMSGEDFEKKYKREQGRGNVGVSEDTKREIYSKTSPCINSIDNHCMSNIDI